MIQLGLLLKTDDARELVARISEGSNDEKLKGQAKQAGEAADNSVCNKFYKLMLDQIIDCLESLIKDYEGSVGEVKKFFNRVTDALESSAGVKFKENETVRNMVNLGQKIFSELQKEKDNIRDYFDMTMIVMKYLIENYFSTYNVYTFVKSVENFVSSEDFKKIVEDLLNGLHDDQSGFKQKIIEKAKYYMNNFRVKNFELEPRVVSQKCVVAQNDEGKLSAKVPITIFIDKLTLEIEFSNFPMLINKIINYIIKCALFAISKIPITRKFIEDIVHEMMEKARHTCNVDESLLTFELNLNDVTEENIKDLIQTNDEEINKDLQIAEENTECSEFVNRPNPDR